MPNKMPGRMSDTVIYQHINIYGRNMSDRMPDKMPDQERNICPIECQAICQTE